MTKSTITRERLEEIRDYDTCVTMEESAELARMALAVMDSESGCLPLDYLQGHKDGLEWDAQLAEANHPETGDWLYDDPIELAKAIRKGPDMPPAQPVADSEPVAWTWQHLKQWHVTNDEERARDLAWDGVKVEPLYRHAQQPVVPDESYQQLSELYHAQEKRLFKIAQRIKGPSFDKYSHSPSQAIDVLEVAIFGDDEFCRAAMLAAAPQSPGSEPATVPGKWIPVSEQMPPSRHEVLVGRWWGEKPRWCCKWATYIPGHPDAQSSGWLIPGASWTPTHWMPLPAAPQEGK